MKLINADLVVHWEAYDDEHESFTRHSGTIAEFLDQMTDEGCPETVDAVPVRCKDCKHREFYGLYFLTCERHRMSVDADYYCADGIREDGGDGKTD